MTWEEIFTSSNPAGGRMINVISGVAGSEASPYTANNPSGGRAINVNIVAGGAGTGFLQIAGGVLDTTLRTVTDNATVPVSSTLQLSTTQVRISGNGAVSAPAFSSIGTWYSGGSTTTTKPYWLIEPTGATSTAWSTAGTGLGINAASGFTGNLADFQLNGASRFMVTAAGVVTATTSVNTGSTRIETGGVISINSGYFAFGTDRSYITSPSNGNLRLTNSAGNSFGLLQFGGTTSSFVALLYNTTTITSLDARLADNTGYTFLRGKLTTETNYTAGAIVPTGYLTLYDATGTAYRVPCVV